MAEAQAIKEAVRPDQILMVVDAMTGQDVVNVVEAFASAVDFDGVIMSKMDGDARGGGALSIREVTGKPIKFISSARSLIPSSSSIPTVWPSAFWHGRCGVVHRERRAHAQAEEEEMEAERLMRGTLTWTTSWP